MTFDTLTSLGRRSTKFVASCNGAALHAVALLIAASACGSGAVDVGTLPNPDDGGDDPVGSAGSAGTSSGPDAGGGPDPVSQCSIPGLERHRLVFDSDEGQLERRIYSMRADGSEVVPITSAGVLAREPAMSPDGNVLAYATAEGIELLDVNAESTDLFAPFHEQPAWSPDGLRLAASYLGGITILDRMNDMDARDVSCGGNFCPFVAWSMDGSEIIYTDEGVSSDGSLYLMNALELETGAGRAIVPKSAIRAVQPTASPDGVWLAAAYDCPGDDNSSLWLSQYAISTPACEGRRVTPPNAPAVTNPSWGPGVLIAYERGEPPRDIAIIAADTGEECVIEMPGDQRNPSWMPESTFEPK